MTFQNLRNNHQVYVLHKTIPPTLEMGKVVSVSAPIPKYGNLNMHNDFILDIQVDINGNTTNFQKLPANGEIADFGNSLVIACDKSAINNEVMSMKQKSKDIIDSVDEHRSNISGCEKILQIINPEIAEKQKQEEENKALRDEITSLKNLVQEFIKQSLKNNNYGNDNRSSRSEN